MEGRPFNLVTPRYDEDFQETAGTVRTDWRFTLEKFYSEKAKTQRLSEGDPRKYADMASDLSGKGNYAQTIKASNLDYMNLVPTRGR